MWHTVYVYLRSLGFEAINSIMKEDHEVYLSGLNYKTANNQCAVPEYIHTPLTEGFLNWTPHPSGNSILASYFRSKHRAFETPLPLGISINLSWGRHGYFLEQHNKSNTVVFYSASCWIFWFKSQTNCIWANSPTINWSLPKYYYRQCLNIS